MNARTESPQLLAALELAAMGFRVFPITPGEKAPPLITRWPTLATTDETLIRAWWGTEPDANIGIACKDLAVVDLDVRNGKAGADSFALLDMSEGFPPTLTSLTPSGGKHVLYRLPEGHPGVGNSVQSLGAGLDIRSTGGYIVAPGSQLTGHEKPYAWEDGAMAIAPAPDWLLNRLGEAVAKSAPAVEVPDASGDLIGQADAWLSTQAPAVEGGGGDAHTYAVACGLRDLGVSESQAVELLSGAWNDRCSPPWSPADLQAKARNAYRYAQNEPACKAITLDGFEPVPVKEPVAPAVPAPAATLPNFRCLDDLATKAKHTRYLVKKLLNQKSYAEIYGPPGSGKSFLCLDLAYHVATGKDWMGSKVKQGPVLYLAYEGGGGLGRRAQALIQERGPAADLIVLTDVPYNLRDPKHVDLFLEHIAIQFKDRPPALIVADTFAYALRGADENSAKDVSAFNVGVARIIEKLGSCFLIVHHSGKDASKGARGSSALLGAVDTEIEVSVSDDTHAVTQRKQRDMELGPELAFTLAPIAIGVDEDGDAIYSCVVEEAAVQVGQAGWRPKKGTQTDIALSLICTTPAQKGGTITREELLPAYTAKAYPMGAKAINTPRLTLNEALKRLIEHELIAEVSDGIWKAALR